jgi:uncharacterized protein YkwD
MQESAVKLVCVLSKSHICTVLVVGLVAFAIGAQAAAAAPKRSAELTLLQTVNATRAAHGLRPLRLDARLGKAARSWSATLLRTNSFTHGDFAGRMATFGISGLAGENLAWGSGSFAAPRSVVAMWLASPGHRANLLKPSYRRIGLGIVRGTFQGYGGATVVAADFGG